MVRRAHSLTALHGEETHTPRRSSADRAWRWMTVGWDRRRDDGISRLARLWLSYLTLFDLAPMVARMMDRSREKNDAWPRSPSGLLCTATRGHKGCDHSTLFRRYGRMLTLHHHSDGFVHGECLAFLFTNARRSGHLGFVSWIWDGASWGVLTLILFFFCFMSLVMTTTATT